ncbi:unnamed protein product [Closterium sp. NIES-64]|nr:unnamed protein product [Closterium sp. NIES-64]
MLLHLQSPPSPAVAASEVVASEPFTSAAAAAAATFRPCTPAAASEVVEQGVGMGYGVWEIGSIRASAAAAAYILPTAVAATSPVVASVAWGKDIPWGWTTGAVTSPPSHLNVPPSHLNVPPPHLTSPPSPFPTPVFPSIPLRRMGAGSNEAAARANQAKGGTMWRRVLAGLKEVGQAVKEISRLLFSTQSPTEDSSSALPGRHAQGAMRRRVLPELKGVGEVVRG